MNKEIRNAICRVDRARRFPMNTCPASRHVVDIARDIEANRDIGCGEHDFVALSLLATVEALWKARTEIARLRAQA